MVILIADLHTLEGPDFFLHSPPLSLPLLEY